MDTLRHFHQRRFVVFVESSDDIPFWQCVFGASRQTDVYIKPAGGRQEVMKYARAIAEDGADVVVARDRDLDDMTGDIVDHPRIVYTFGYAIENSLCTQFAVAAVLRILLYTNDEQNQAVEEWLANTENRFARLIELDLAARLAAADIAIPLDNAARYLDRRRGCRVSSAVVKGLARPVELKVGLAVLKRARNALRNSPKPMRYFLRGHCLFSAVFHYVRYRRLKHTGKNIVLSNDALFGLLMAHCVAGLEASGQRAYYDERVQRLVAVA